MENEKFWNEANNGSIRELVAEFIDRLPLLSRFKDDEYFELEDAFVDFIKDKREIIAQEVKNERIRDFVLDKIVANSTDGRMYRLLSKVLPIEVLDNVVNTFYDLLGNDDDYDACEIAATEDAIKLELFGDIPDFYGLTRREESVYCAYLKEWFEEHSGIEYRKMYPSLPFDFFANEMEDVELAKHYNELADKFEKENV